MEKEQNGQNPNHSQPQIEPERYESVIGGLEESRHLPGELNESKIPDFDFTPPPPSESISSDEGI